MTIIISVILILLLLLFAQGFLLIRFALSRSYQEKHQTDLAGEEIRLSSDAEISKLLADGERVSVTSFDNLKLVAHFMKANEKSHNYIIAMHGYHGHPDEMAHFAFHFMDKFNFNILVPNQRAHGRSEGKYTTMGVYEKLDVLSWIDYLIKRDEKANIMLFGISMGAATVTTTGGMELKKNVKAIIADCGYSSLVKEFKHEIKTVFHLPPFPFLNFASLVSKLKLGFFFKEGDSIKAVKNAKLPMLFIHGDKDTFVPFEMLDEIYSAAACEKEKCIIKNATHALSERENPAEYWKAVDSFTQKYFIARL